MRIHRTLVAAAAAAILGGCAAAPPAPGQQPPAAAAAADSSSQGGATSAAVATDTDCVLTGAKVSNGADAVRRLGPNLDAVARRISTDATDLRAMLLEDPTLHIDGCGHPFYVERAAAAPQPPERTAAAPTPAASPVPYSATFSLHSRPGSLRTIFLDFDGTRIEGTGWNDSYNNGFSWDAPPFDTDGNPGSFSNSERDAIQTVWQKVAEDYAPFDVDVTTEDPGFDVLDRSSTADLRFGTRAIITNDTLVKNQCNCGGIAYVGVFDNVAAAYYQPAIVFTSWGNPNDIAAATSHEVGHNLGLSHNGTSTVEYYDGAGAWAPIMGSGYYKPITQWSKGEYADANNHEDDLAIISSRGAPRIADDHGNTRATATALGAVGPVGATGTITDASDTDWFSITTTGGEITFSAVPAPVGPNLDIELAVTDSAGTTLGTANPESAFLTSSVAFGLDAHLTLTLPAGTYYASVVGTGAGDVSGTGYSDYGSLGAYALAVAANSGPAITTTDLGQTTVGGRYDHLLSAAGGTAPYTWSLASGTLPAGLSINSAGSLSGVPTSTVSTTFALRVTDAGAQAAVRTFTLGAGIKVASQNLPEAQRTTPYSTTLAAIGGTGPYTWSIISGNLPAGVTLSGATISGTPTTTGTPSFTVKVVDSAGRSTTQVLTLSVVDALVAPSTANWNGTIGTPYATSLLAFGGRGTLFWSLTSGSLPPGLTLNTKGAISGTPTAGGTFNSVARVSDRSGRTSDVAVSIAIPDQSALEGNVSNDFGPMDRAQIRIYGSGRSDPVATAVAGADGRWYTQVAPGTYQVEVVPPSGRQIRAWVGGATRMQASSFVVTTTKVTTPAVLLPTR